MIIHSLPLCFTFWIYISHNALGDVNRRYNVANISKLAVSPIFFCLYLLTFWKISIIKSMPNYGCLFLMDI